MDHPEVADTSPGGTSAFTVGERILVHGTRHPYALRPATIVAISESTAHGMEQIYEVEAGLGGRMHVRVTELHAAGATDHQATCHRCAAGTEVTPADLR